MLSVTEIFYSIQGESTFAGLPCVMVRLAGCNLRCSYCDTTYAFVEGENMSIDEVIEKVERLAEARWQCVGRWIGKPNLRLPIVELTGGEPLLQHESLELMTRLCDLGFTVLLETNGSLDITQVDPRVHRIMDLKCPSSGESHRNRMENIEALNPHDEVKFVIASREDYEWAKKQVLELRLYSRCVVLFSWAEPQLTPPRVRLNPVPQDHHPISRQELVEQILRDHLPVRFQVQLHKIVWPHKEQGV